jgi:hypothetical protein
VTGGARRAALWGLAAAFFGDEEAALAEEDSGAFALTAVGFAWSGRSAGGEDLTAVRRRLFVGFGSCSVVEPVEELQALGTL